VWNGCKTILTVFGLSHPFVRVDHESFQAPVTGLPIGYCGKKTAGGKNWQCLKKIVPIKDVWVYPVA
jgi:hypothetical protein